MNTTAQYPSLAVPISGGKEKARKAHFRPVEKSPVEVDSRRGGGNPAPLQGKSPARVLQRVSGVLQRGSADDGKAPPAKSLSGGDSRGARSTCEASSEGNRKKSAPDRYWVLWRPFDIPEATRKRYRLGPPRDVAPHDGLCEMSYQSPQELMKMLVDGLGWKRTDFKDRSNAVFARIEVTPSGFTVAGFDNYRAACAAHLEIKAELSTA